MGSIYDVPSDKLINAVAKDFESNDQIKPPDWAVYVKTGMHKERVPSQKNWWYIRMASVLRKISKLGPVGVAKLRVKYGGKKNRGMKPSKFYRGSGNIIRKVLQQLETAGFAQKVEKGTFKGRIVSPKGRSLLDKHATRLRGPKQKRAPPPPKEEAKPVKPAESAKPVVPAPAK